MLAAMEELTQWAHNVDTVRQSDHGFLPARALCQSVEPALCNGLKILPWDDLATCAFVHIYLEIFKH